MGGVSASFITNSTIYQVVFTRSMQMGHKENLLSWGSRFFFAAMQWFTCDSNASRPKEASRNAGDKQTVEMS